MAPNSLFRFLGAVVTVASTVTVTAQSNNVTTLASIGFGEKDDTVWQAFIGLVAVALFIVTASSIVFGVKTSYKPSKYSDPRSRASTASPNRNSASPKRFTARPLSKDLGEDKAKPPRNDEPVELSDLGSISESNSEDSIDANRRREDIYSVSVDQNSADSERIIPPPEMGIELVDIHGSDEEETTNSSIIPPPPPDPDAGSQASRPGPEVAVNMDIPFENITCGRRIGKGGVGSVYEGTLVGVGKVALKKVSVQGNDQLENLAREAKMMAALRHKHIVFLYGLTVSPQEESVNGRDHNAYLVMELCSDDVGSLIDNSPKLKSEQPATHDDVFYANRMGLMQKIAAQVASTMEFVHSQDVVHRDLKPANILLTEDNNIRIADFGLSKTLSTEQNHQTMEIGTPAYMAPELIVGIQDDGDAVIKVPKKLDVYVFGPRTCLQPVHSS